jgi:hypothetical protein
VQQLLRNPFNSGEIWITDWQTRRHVLQDEYSFWTFVGAQPITISAQWFFSIPVATG